MQTQNSIENCIHAWSGDCKE